MSGSEVRQLHGEWTAKTPLLPYVDLCAGGPKLLRLFVHAYSDRVVLADVVRFGVGADVLGDLHAAEVRAAHRTEVRGLCGIGGQRLVVHRGGGFGVEREVELIAPAKLEAGLRQRIV